MGIMSKLNLPYFEVYSDSSECLVGHLKGVKGGRNRCATKSNVKFPENGEKGKNGKIRRFKPKVVNDRIPSSTVKSTKGVKLVPPLKLADGTEKKRKAAPASRLSGAVKKKAAPDASNVLLRRSPRVADMTQSKLKLYVDDDLTDGQDDDSEDSEGSPLSEDASMHGDNDSGASGEGTSDDDNQTKSFEGKDFEDDEGESNSTATPIEGSNSHSTAVSMEDYEHGVSGDNNVDAQEREPAINVVVYEDNCGEQACKAVETCHGVDTQVNEPAVNFGVCGDNCGEQGESGEVLLETGGTMRRDNNIDAAALVNREVPSCTTSTISSTLDSDKAGNDSPTDFEARFRDFVACFDAKDSLSITVDSITKPLSGNQSPFEGGMVPSEFVVPLTKFAQKYGGGSFSSLFAEGKSTYQKHTLVERFGLQLFSMEVEEVKHEGKFLVWRDLCHDVVDWGLKVGFMFDHLKQAARSFFGYKLKPAGSDNYCKEVLQLEKSVLELRRELVRLEKQLGKAREGLCSKFGNVICPDDVMACILESSWTPQSRATHGLY
uniref:uncharacterized protein LOC105352484 n=1 Tax=Fragaria vesca subsp. vesca TaxID=101020 RepID=UPI0005CB1FD7|nr:PREDICTED: uncharacterized protein LOC105352484 [Fragaria vesca subsp. vesca]